MEFQVSGFPIENPDELQSYSIVFQLEITCLVKCQLYDKSSQDSLWIGAVQCHQYLIKNIE